MIVWDKLTVTNTYGAATMSMNAAGLLIDKSISVPAINVDSITANNGVQIDTTATFSGNVTISGSTTLSSNATVSGSAIFNDTATFNGSTTFNGSATFNGSSVTLKNAQNNIVLPSPGASQKILQVSEPGSSESHSISIRAIGGDATLTLSGLDIVTYGKLVANEIKATNGVAISTYSTDTGLQLKYGIARDKIDDVLTNLIHATTPTEFGKLTIVRTFDLMYDIYLQVGGLNSTQTASGWVVGDHPDHWWFIELLNSYIPYSILDNSTVLNMNAYENKRISPDNISGNNTLYGYKSEWQVALIKKDDKYYLCLGLDSHTDVTDALISGIGHIRVYPNNN